MSRDTKLGLVWILLVLLAIVFFQSTTGEAKMNQQEKLYTLHTVVLITVSSANGGTGGTGSGVVIYSQGDYTLILTALHVVSHSDVGGLYVTLYPSEKMVPAALVKRSDKSDLALLRIDVHHQYVAKRSKMETLPVFTPVIKMGAGLGQDPFPTLGIIEDFADNKGLMRVSSPIIMGDSGGGIFNAYNGELIGIAFGVPVSGFEGHPVLVSHMGMCFNIFAINDFLSR